MPEKEKAPANPAKDQPAEPQPSLAPDLESLIDRIESGLANLDTRSANADLIGAIGAVILRSYRR